MHLAMQSACTCISTCNADLTRPDLTRPDPFFYVTGRRSIALCPALTTDRANSDADNTWILGFGSATASRADRRSNQ